MIKLGLIGLGRWGVNYLNTIKNIKGVNIKYICARSQKTLNNFSDHYNKTTNYKDLLDYPDLDGVIIATPASTHFGIAFEFIKKLIPVLVEKPFVTNLTDAIKLQQAADKHKSCVLVGHIYLYHPAIIKMKQLLPNIGKLRYVETQGGNFGPFREDVSALWDWAPHDVSLCLYLTGKEPININAWGQNYTSHKKTEEDNIQIRMDFPGKISSYSNFGRMFPVKKRSITVMGEKGALIFNEMEKNKLVSYNFQNHEFLKDRITLKPIYPKYHDIPPLQLELTSFCRYIKAKIHPVSDLEQTVKVTKIISLAEKTISHCL